MDKEEKCPPDVYNDSEIIREEGGDNAQVGKDETSFKSIRIEHACLKGSICEALYTTVQHNALEIVVIELRYAKFIREDQALEQLRGTCLSSHVITPLYYPRGSAYELDVMINRTEDGKTPSAEFGRSTSELGAGVFEITCSFDAELFDEIKNLVMKNNLETLEASFDLTKQDKIYHHYVAKDLVVDERREAPEYSDDRFFYESYPAIPIGIYNINYSVKNNKLDVSQSSIYKRQYPMGKEKQEATLFCEDGYVSDLKKRVLHADKELEENINHSLETIVSNTDTKLEKKLELLLKAVWILVGLGITLVLLSFLR